MWHCKTELIFNYMSEKSESQIEEIDFNTFKNQVLCDYQLICESREASLLGRKEVLTGKAKFGIFGDGKELAQIALAKQFKNGILDLAITEIKPG